jgi:hypothetical protein
MQKSWKRCASDRIQSSEDAQAGFLEKLDCMKMIKLDVLK